MTDDDLRDLDRVVMKLKRLASEWASKLHDLVEDRLPAGWQEIPEISQGTLEACKAWAEANSRLQAAQKG